jgi:hypothetical protein
MGNKQFKIYGLERKKLKKEVSELRSFLKDFWFHHQMDKDMSSFYGGSDNYPMTDENAKEMFKNSTEELGRLEKLLSEKYEK